jgi:hypothetical protein
MISVACSSYFQRTAASLVVSYLLILPLALAGVLFWYWLADGGQISAAAHGDRAAGDLAGGVPASLLFANTSARLLHPPDVGSEGKEVVDLEQEAQQAVGW